MAKFDRSHTYQFVLFFPQNVFVIGQHSAPPELGEVVSRFSGAGARLGLKFGTPQIETIISPTGPTQAVVWAAGGGIWRMSYSLQRLDLIFDAMGFSDISSEDISVHSVCERVSANLVEALALLSTVQRPVVRAAIVLTAQASKDADGSAGVVRALRSFLREDSQNLSVAGEIDDVSVRVNRTAQWQLDAAQWRANRIEAASVDVAFKSNGDVERLFSWQLDANTSFADGQPQLTRQMNSTTLGTFLELARDWIAARFEASEDANVALS